MEQNSASSLRHATWADLGLWLLRRRRRFRVEGRSMLPTLEPGEEVLINPWAYGQCPPRVQDLVIAEHPQRPGFRLIKRVVAVDEAGCCDLRGDNPAESTDSRQLGWAKPNGVLGQVVCYFP